LLRRLLNNLRWSVLPVPGRVIAIVFFVALFIFPLFTDRTYYLYILTISNLLVIFAVSWDLLSGYSGQVNFGHALFFGVSAYSVALLNDDTNRDPDRYRGWSVDMLSGSEAERALPVIAYNGISSHVDGTGHGFQGMDRR